MRYYTDITLQAIAFAQAKCDHDDSWRTLTDIRIFLTDMFQRDLAINRYEMIPQVPQDLIIARQFLFAEILLINKRLNLLYEQKQKAEAKPHKHAA